MSLSENIDKRLTEAEAEQDALENEELPVDGEGESTVEAPATASVDEIADAVVAATEIGSEGEQTVAPAAAKNVAQEVKSIAAEIEAGAFGSLWVENDLTDILDKALATSLKLRRQTRTGNTNVLVTGLPGSSKTAVVYEWAKRNGINVHYLDAKNNDLEADINGYVLRDNTNQEGNAVAKAYSKVLDPLDRPNSVLFLDELNRQTNSSIRASLLTLVNEKCVSGPDETGRRNFPNLLFTIACINPATPTDRGAADLNDAEKTRYAYSVEFDSSVDTALDYFKRQYTKSIAELNPNDKYFKQDLDEYIHSLALAYHILHSFSFEFNTKNDLDALADYRKNMLNQRSLTDGIVASSGNAADFRWWVDKSSNFLDETKEMLNKIMDSYNEADAVENAKKLIRQTVDDMAKGGKITKRLAQWVKNLIDGKIDQLPSDETEAENATTDAEKPKVEDEFEDDTDFFQKQANTGRTAMSKAARVSTVANINWNV